MLEESVGLLWWTIALVACVPIAVIALGELSSRLERAGSRYQPLVDLVRTVLLPSAVVVILARAILSIGREQLPSQLAVTVLLIAFIYVGSLFLREVSAEKRLQRWENRIPGLFKILLRIAVVLVPLIVLFNTWGIDLSRNLGALGIGGVAIAFALQDAIGNVVSGVLLVVDRPFTVGDWIEVNGLRGEVIDVSWRSTRIKIDRDVMILPNIELSNSSIRNLTALDPGHEAFVDFSFASDDRPSVAKQMLLDIAVDNESIATEPPPEVHLTEYGDSSTSYRLYYHLERYLGVSHADGVQDQLRTTVFHAHARYGLSMPYPTFVSIRADDQAPDVRSKDVEAAEYLRWNRVFAALPDDVLVRLSSHIEHRSFAGGETIVSPHVAVQHLYLVNTGQVELRSSSASDYVELLGPGDVVGEDALVSQLVSPWRAQALTDVDLYTLDVKLISKVSEQHPKFAASINRLMVERQRLLHLTRHQAGGSRAGAGGNSIDLTAQVNDQEFGEGFAAGNVDDAASR